jgi:hypothetical protein
MLREVLRIKRNGRRGRYRQAPAEPQMIPSSPAAKAPAKQA